MLYPKLYQGVAYMMTLCLDRAYSSLAFGFRACLPSLHTEATYRNIRGIGFNLGGLPVLPASTVFAGF